MLVFDEKRPYVQRSYPLLLFVFPHLYEFLIFLNTQFSFGNIGCMLVITFKGEIFCFKDDKVIMAFSDTRNPNCFGSAADGCAKPVNVTEKK